MDKLVKVTDFTQVAKDYNTKLDQLKTELSSTYLTKSELTALTDRISALETQLNSIATTLTNWV